MNLLHLSTGGLILGFLRRWRRVITVSSKPIPIKASAPPAAVWLHICVLPVDTLTDDSRGWILKVRYAAAAIVVSGMAAVSHLSGLRFCVAISHYHPTVAGSRVCACDRGDERAGAHVERYLDVV